jgi:ABC-type multidrug transport system ATPase subunit/pSer/pThr/pTyr-binding forkhead associated (FHA) protein
LDANSATVSRNHARIEKQDSQFVLFDNGSFNGTLVNDQRIAAPTPIYDGDKIQLGMGGPILTFIAPGFPPPSGASLTGQRAVSQQFPDAHAAKILATQGQPQSSDSPKTIVFKAPTGDIQQPSPGTQPVQPQLLMQLSFDGKNELKIGRSPENEIRLDGLQISNRHARLTKSGMGVVIEDLGSTNGVYLGGRRITGKQNISANDMVQIGSFVLKVDPAGNVYVFDTRSKTRIDSLNITKIVKNRSGSGTIKLLDDVSLSIQPNEFVGLLGPSGAGKSTLMDALNGMRPASNGTVLINNLNFYEHLNSLKQGIGYVPQDDIIHRELTVYRTLYYVAKLRLSADVSAKEIDQIINEVMDVTGLSERRDVPVSQLSGGQRKRVSIAVELITKPSVIFLDEPTSGLDPATEEKIMKLFRQIAESGRTVILTTHAMENVKLFDKIVVLMRGKLVFYGAPQEALKHLGADSFKDLYDKLEAPIEQRIQQLGELPPNASGTQKSQFKKQREQITEEVAEGWKQNFKKTEQYKRNVHDPLSRLQYETVKTQPPRRNLGVFGSIRQLVNLSRRYFEVLWRDKFNLFILFAQAPIIALMTYLVVASDRPRDFIYFIIALVAMWFGTSVASREIIRERPVYNRERMVNLGLLPYVGSKLLILGVIVAIQCLLLFLPLKFLDIVGLMKMPGDFIGIPQLFVMLLTAGTGIAVGLLISALVKTSEMATSLVPLILIPQILFSGLLGMPEGPSRVIGLVMPTTWAFDTMKRYTDLKTLNEEGDKDKKKNCQKEDCGLYEEVENKNDELIADARQDIEEYKKDAEDDLDDFDKKMRDFVDDLKAGKNPTQPKKPELKPAPKIKEAEKIPPDLSGYVDFKHPWMHELVNQIVLIFMFFGLVIATVIVLRSQDIG